MHVQEVNSEIGSSQNCHKRFKFTAFLSLICPVSSLLVFLEIHSCVHSDSGLQSIVSMIFSNLKKRYLEKKEESMTCLNRESGGSSDATVKRRGQGLDTFCIHC